jgi:hypothetical protein
MKLTPPRFISSTHSVPSIKFSPIGTAQKISSHSSSTRGVHFSLFPHRANTARVRWPQTMVSSPTPLPSLRRVAASTSTTTTRPLSLQTPLLTHLSPTTPSSRGVDLDHHDTSPLFAGPPPQSLSLCQSKFNCPLCLQVTDTFSTSSMAFSQVLVPFPLPRDAHPSDSASNESPDLLNAKSACVITYRLSRKH